mgnify:CR=1 FL=1
MKILYIEPYLGKSHLAWFQGLKQHSKHDFEILHLPGSKWKWRMHGGAITMANMFNNLNSNYDLIICSDFLNLPIFKSLCHNKIGKYHVDQYLYDPKHNRMIFQNLCVGYLNYREAHEFNAWWSLRLIG